MNTDGIQSVRVLPDSTTNTGLAGFQAVYPRASQVARRPPDGKLEASGSLWMSCAPVNFSIGFVLSSKLRKASCFSAVRPVCGWNQWVKCVTPRLSAHSLMACATAGATSMSSFLPRRMDWASLSHTAFGSFSFIWRAPNALIPKYAEIGAFVRLSPVPFPLLADGVRGARAVRSRSVVLRVGTVGAVIARNRG